MGVRRDLDAVPPFRLRRRHHRRLLSLHPTATERHPHRIAVHVGPSQPEQLGAPGPGHRSQQDQDVEHRITRLDVVEQLLQLGRCRRVHLGRRDDDPVSSFHGLAHTHPHRIACENADRSTTWIRLSVPGLSGPPLMLPRSRSTA